MIDDIRNFGRFQAGKIKPKLKFIDGYASALHSVGNHSYLAEQKGIKLINEVQPGTRLYADPCLFYEVIQNLVSNAVKFCRKGDRITVYTPPGNDPSIAVKDTGPGINKSVLPDVFRADIKTSTVGTAGETGAGLGLSYSHDIMKAHGGTLTVESEEGKGTTIIVQLPYVKPVAMVIDDQRTTLYFVSEMLNKIDVDIISAEDGGKALNILEETPPHIIICDVGMPLMSGIAFLERIKRRPETESIPFIMLSSDAGDETRERALKMGADEYIEKQSMFHQLIPLVRKLIM